ncbi:MAG TPA: DUF362 domain-containing protein [Polyangia bacterium]|jgi:uncharacterized protein (DUF362 family)
MTLTRRELLRLGAGAAAGGLLAAAGCAGPLRTTPNAEFLALPQSAAGGRAALGVFASRDLRAACERIVPAVSDLSWLRRGDSVFVKVACNSPNEHPAVTSPDAVRAMVGFLRDHGAGRVYVGDQAGVEHVRLTPSGRVRSTRALMARNGLLQAAADAGAILHCFDDRGWDGYVAPPRDFAGVWQGDLFVARVLDEVDHVVNLPRLGTHAIAGYTCGVKNAVGWLRDDSRRVLHQRGARFFERIAEINHIAPLRAKLRLTVTLAHRALLNIGPDFGGTYRFDGCLALAARRLVDHDAVASALLPWLDGDSASFFDLYAPYPRHVNFWNRGLVKDTWGKPALAAYEPILPFPRGAPLAHDAGLAHLARLEGYRPARIAVALSGERVPPGLVAHLRARPDRLFAL